MFRDSWVIYFFSHLIWISTAHLHLKHTLLSLLDLPADEYAQGCWSELQARERCLGLILGYSWRQTQRVNMMIDCTTINALRTAKKKKKSQSQMDIFTFNSELFQKYEGHSINKVNFSVWRLLIQIEPNFFFFFLLFQHSLPELWCTFLICAQTSIFHQPKNLWCLSQSLTTLWTSSRSNLVPTTVN